MKYSLHSNYSGMSLLQPVDTTTIYRSKTTQVVRNNQTLSLLGEFNCNFLSSHNANSELNYFTSPTSLLVSVSSKSLAGSLLMPVELVAKWPPSETLLNEVAGDKNSIISEILYSKMNNICIFGRNEPTGDYYFLGNAVLCGVGFSDNTWKMNYELQVKLSRFLWVYFRGYKGWLVSVNAQIFEVADIDEIMKLLGTLSQRSEFSLQLSRYEGDMLQAGVNKDNEAFVSYSSVVGEQLFSGTYESNGEWVAFDNFNDAFEVPSSTLIPRVRAMEIIETFLFSGQPPDLSITNKSSHP